MKTNSFSGRITRRIVLSMLLLMSFVAVLVFIFARAEITALTSVHYQDILKNTNDKVEGMLDKVEVSAVNNLAEIQKSLVVYMSQILRLKFLRGTAVSDVS